MDRQRFKEIMIDEEDKIEVDWKGDNAFQGLQIIAKYISPDGHDLITGADHDVFYSVDIDELLEAGITEEDAIALRKLNWILEEEEYLACFV